MFCDTVETFLACDLYIGSKYEKVRGGVYCGGIRFVGVGFKYRHYFGLCEIAIVNGFADVQLSTLARNEATFISMKHRVKITYCIS